MAPRCDSARHFFDFAEPMAAQAHDATGVEVSVILAQWANETAYGTSKAWVEGNNFAGVSPEGHIAEYQSLDDGLAHYIATMELHYYDEVRHTDSGPIDQAEALGRSPWAASHYDAGPGPGSSLVAIIRDHDLTTYDSEPAPPAGGADVPNPTDHVRRIPGERPGTELILTADGGVHFRGPDDGAPVPTYTVLRNDGKRFTFPYTPAGGEEIISYPGLPAEDKIEGEYFLDLWLGSDDTGYQGD